MISILDQNYFHYYGRILAKENSAVLGFTNSSVEFYLRKDPACKHAAPVRVTAAIASDTQNQVDWARLKVYIDDVLAAPEPIVLDEPCKTYEIATIADCETHKITIVKITEAQMSYAQFQDIHVENGILRLFHPIQTTVLK